MKSPGQITEDLLPITTEGFAIAPFCDWRLQSAKGEHSNDLVAIVGGPSAIVGGHSAIDGL